jgi:DNA-binding GntR family transcriptional regulator
MPVIESGAINVLEREKNQPIHQWVYKVLRTSIIEIHIRPTQALSEKEIADLLGVSRTPVREAFIRLAEDGLLTITPQKRSLVTPIDLAQAEEARFVRRALEKAVMKEVCGRLTDEDQSALAANIEAQRECRSARSFDRMLLVDNDFHRIIFRASRKERSWLYIKKLDYNYDRLRIMVMPRVIEQVIAEHRQILEILTRGTVDRVDQTIDGHLSSAAINRTVQEFPSHYFTRPGRSAADNGIGAVGEPGSVPRKKSTGEEAVGRFSRASRGGSATARRRNP